MRTTNLGTHIDGKTRFTPNPRSFHQAVEALEARMLLSAVTYTIKDLGALTGGNSQALAINDAGQVVGVSTDSVGREHAVLWSGGRMIDLGLLNNQQNSQATAINASGKIVGTIINSSGQQEAVILSSSSATPTTLLGSLSGRNSVAEGINSSGLVVGTSTLSSGASQAAEFTAPASTTTLGTVVDLGTLGGFSSFAFGVNDSAYVVGVSDLSSGLQHAFLYSPAAVVTPGTAGVSRTGRGFAMNDLGTLGGNFSEATAINNLSQVVGFSDAADGTQEAFLWQNGSMQSLGVLSGGSSSEANAINSLGVVVGSAAAGNGQQHAFVWSGGVMTDLNPTPPVISAFTITQANGINASGEIAAIGVSGTGVQHALLLVPNAPAPDLTPPVAALTSAPTLLRGGRTNHPIQVTFTDNTAVDVSTLGDGNIIVRGPNRARQSMNATFVSATPDTNAATIVATYNVPAPASGVWTSADDGTYSVTLQGRQVTDTSSNAERGAVLGTFTVAIPIGRTIARPAEMLLPASTLPAPPHAAVANSTVSSDASLFSTQLITGAAMFD